MIIYQIIVKQNHGSEYKFFTKDLEGARKGLRANLPPAWREEPGFFQKVSELWPDRQGGGFSIGEQRFFVYVKEVHLYSGEPENKEEPAKVEEPEDDGKDVHTEHCCIVHGCKYKDQNCTVTSKEKPQSHPCEDCGGYGFATLLGLTDYGRRLLP